MSVYEKLAKARVDLQSQKLDKSGHNKFAGYKYFELGDFIPTIQKLFAEYKLLGFVSFGAEKATLTITDWEDGSNIIIESPMSTAALKGCHEVQNLGAVQTYIRRYLWVSALEIVEHDALDATTGNNNVQKLEPKTGKSPNDGALDEMSPEEIKFLRDMAEEIIEDMKDEKVETAYGRYMTLDNEEKRGIWTMLDSKIRAAIKKYGETTKQAA